MTGLHGFVESREQLYAIWRDSGHHRPPVLGFPASRDQAPLLQTVEQPSNIWVVRNHAAGDFPTREPFGCAAQDSEHVVLRRRESLGLEHGDEAARQHVYGAQQIQERGFLRIARSPWRVLRLSRSLHFTSTLFVITTVVNTYLKGGRFGGFNRSL